MLSELQSYCLDAMGLSHGLAPKDVKLPSSTLLNQQSLKQQGLNPARPAISSQTNAPQSIKAILPKCAITEFVEPKKAMPHKGLAPKDVQNLSNWSSLQTAVSHCQWCQELAKNRSQTLFGAGNEAAELMIIGEAPSSDEDIQGHPFVGKSGELLNNMLISIGIKRENIYISNIIKCHPPNNRDPHKDESDACGPFLNAQINHIKPKLLLALGRIAAHSLLNVKTPVGQLRGRLHQHAASQTDLIISYHPAYLLRNPHQKPKSWDDLKDVHRYLTK